MASREGWISIHRAIQDNWIWKDGNKVKWWLDILLTVNTSPAKVNIGNDIIECKRGDSLLSIQSWANRWGVSKDTARNFFTLLEKDKMICRVNLGKTTRLTVCKYDTYQQPLHVNSPPAVRTPYTNNKEDKEYIGNIDVENAFKDFINMRTKMKKIVTERAEKSLRKKLNEIGGVSDELKIKIIDKSILKSYTDFYPLEDERKLKDLFSKEIKYEDVDENQF